MTVVTLRDVAEAAGVSVSTASRALLDKGHAYRISERTVQAIKQQAQRLGFQHNAMARSLQSQRSGLVGVVVPDVANPFFAAITKEVTLRAESQGLSVLLADSRESTSVEVKLLSQLHSRRVEGLVVCPVGVSKSHLEELESSGTPLVIVDRCFLNTSLVSVMSDNRSGAQVGVDQLLSHGHRVIGCIQGLPGTLPNEMRLSEIRKRLKESGLSLSDSQVAGSNFTEQSGYEAAMQLLQQRPDITALFALCSPSAFGAMRAAEQLQRKIPQELSLITFDHSPAADLLRTPLTTISQDVEQLGQLAANLLVDQLITGKKTRTKKHVIPVRMVVRQSVSNPWDGPSSGASIRLSSKNSATIAKVV
jgi:LacI family transcriptional regulator